MCGIFGYIGVKDPLKMCLNGLEQLEYRGYDSTGIAGISEGHLSVFKEAGKLAFLKPKIPLQALDVVIGHTRWATHGKVTSPNAHPHTNTEHSIALIHNGIIENYASLKEDLKKEGVAFQSETDTEVIVHLISKYYKGDLVEAVHKTLPLLRGIFAIALIHKDHPDQIVATTRECPLSIGYDDKHTESILSSDPNAFLGSILNVLFLRNGEIARVKKGNVDVFDASLKLIFKKPERFESEYKPAAKEGFEHFMLKEIFEQPLTVQKAMLGRIVENHVELEPFNISQEFLKGIEKIWILGCGTSAHAGAIACLYFEDLAGIPTTSEIASEARYRTPILTPNTLVIAVSQSGETADTIAAVREAKKRGCKVLGVCNVKNSLLTREADGCLFLKAGPEISVCSTKAFTSQVTVLILLALYLANLKGRPKPAAFYEEMKKIPSQIQEILNKAPEIQILAKKYSRYNNFFFMGRNYMVPTCMEAALKLKEISYVNANGYPAGELKHGPIALIDAEFPVIAFCANRKTEEKIASNLMEVKARGAPVLAFASTHHQEIKAIAEDVFWLPSTIDELAPLLSTVAGQLFAYSVAKNRGGCDIDQPRNLAKSVTVE